MIDLPEGVETPLNGCSNHLTEKLSESIKSVGLLCSVTNRPQGLIHKLAQSQREDVEFDLVVKVDFNDCFFDYLYLVFVCAFSCYVSFLDEVFR